MYDESVALVVNPERSEIEDTIEWLREEWEKNENGEGFYNNQRLIWGALEKGNAMVLKHLNDAIGLLIWTGHNVKVEVDIFTIKESHRNLGFGRTFYEKSISFFSKKGFFAIELFCMPESSEFFWKRMGMISYPECGIGIHPLSYYKNLVETASEKFIKYSDYIELWDDEPDYATYKASRWSWYIECEDGFLKKPIVQPCNPNWKLRWSRNGKVFKESKVKYFTDSDFELYKDNFLIIDECISNWRN